MPSYLITDNKTGQKYKVTGDSPPTDAEIQQIVSAHAPAPVTPTAPVDTTEGMNPVQKLLSGIGGSMYMAGKGIEQKGAQLGESLGIVSPETTQRISQEGMSARQDLQNLERDSTLGKVGSVVGDIAPGMVIPGGVGGGLLKRIVTGALAGSGQGASRFTGEGESTIKNAIAGGAIGGAIPAVTGGATKLFNTIAGKTVKLLNIGAEKGIPTTLGEDIGNPHLQRVETFMERIPLIGMMNFRKKQYDASVASAKDYIGKYVAGEGDRGMLEANRNYVSNLYENTVKPKIAEITSTYVPKETIKIAGEISNQYPELLKKFGDKKVLDVVQNFRTEQKGLYGPKAHSFDDLWELRKGLGDILQQAKAKTTIGGGADVSVAQYSQLSRMYSAVNSDMDKMALSAGKPELSSVMKTANDAYKQFVVKYNVIDRAMDKAMGQEGTGKLFSPQRFSSELNRILTKEKYSGVFTEVEKKEMAGLANIMTTVKRAGQLMENPPTGNRMVDVAIGGGAMGSFFSPAAAATMGTTAGTTVVAKFLTTSPIGKRLVMSASSIEPDSPAMKSIVEAAIKGSRAMAVNSNILDSLKGYKPSPQMNNTEPSSNGLKNALLATGGRR
jgi:hypothetical protein